MHLVGRPYSFPANPPASFDCWKLVRYVRELRGLACPLPFSDEEAWCRPDALPEAVSRARGTWRVLEQPAQNCMAVLSSTHVGVVVDNGVLHAWAGSGNVVWTRMRAILRVWPSVEWWEAVA